MKSNRMTTPTPDVQHTTRSRMSLPGNGRTNIMTVYCVLSVSEVNAYEINVLCFSIMSFILFYFLSKLVKVYAFGGGGGWGLSERIFNTFTWML